MAADDGAMAVAVNPNDAAVLFGSNVGTSKGIEIWGIENLKPTPWPKDRYGEFCTGEAYMVLNTIEPGKQYDLFFWLGDAVGVGERGACAYFVVDLDQHLKDVPIQYRECQGSESGKFAALWKHSGGFHVVSGGAASAFTHVEAGEGLGGKARLLRCKGRRAVRLDEVKLESASLNDGDVFVLQQHDVIYIWEGKESNRWEKQKAGDSAEKLNNANGGKARLVRLSESPDEAAGFWAALGGEGPVAPASEGGDDALFERNAAASVRLFNYEDSGKWTQITGLSAPPPRSALDSNQIVLVDSGSENTGIYVWVGKDVPKQKVVAQ